jgi:hypothetical protein
MARSRRTQNIQANYLRLRLQGYFGAGVHVDYDMRNVGVEEPAVADIVEDSEDAEDFEDAVIHSRIYIHTHIYIFISFNSVFVFCY